MYLRTGKMVYSEVTDLANPRQGLESQTLMVNISLASCPVKKKRCLLLTELSCYVIYVE